MALLGPRQVGKTALALTIAEQRPSIYLDLESDTDCARLSTLEEVLGHPVAGASREGFVIETLSATAPPGTHWNFYRTAAGVEIDLLLTLPGQRLWAVEIKRSLTPKVEKGFYQACEDLAPQRRIAVFPGSERFRFSTVSKRCLSRM